MYLEESKIIVIKIGSSLLVDNNKKVRKEDFINFEIIWDSYKIFYPTTLDLIIKKFIQNPKKKYLIIPIGIEL